MKRSAMGQSTLVATVNCEILSLQILANVALDELESIVVPLTHKGNRLTTTAHSPGPADTMHVLLYILRLVVIDNSRYGRDIQATGCKVGGYKQA